MIKATNAGGKALGISSTAFVFPQTTKGLETAGSSDPVTFEKSTVTTVKYATPFTNSKVLNAVNPIMAVHIPLVCLGSYITIWEVSG